MDRLVDGVVHEGPTTVQRRVPLQELPLYVRNDSLVVLGPERNHVAEKPADPLTVEAFVTNEAVFTLRGDAETVVFRCRRQDDKITFEASAAPATFVVRLRAGVAATSILADDRALSRMETAALDQTQAGWAIADQLVVVKARARRIEVR